MSSYLSFTGYSDDQDPEYKKHLEAVITPEGVVFSHPEPPQRLIWMLLNKLENCYKLD